MTRQHANLDTLIRLWGAYNESLAHIISNIPAEKLAAECRIGDADPVTLEFLMRDYLDHMNQHLRQLQR